MSNDKLPVRYYPVGYKGYRLDQDEDGNELNLTAQFLKKKKPEKRVILLTPTYTGTIGQKEALACSRGFFLTYEEACENLEEACQTGHLVVFQGTLEQTETLLDRFHRSQYAYILMDEGGGNIKANVLSVPNPSTQNNHS